MRISAARWLLPALAGLYLILAAMYAAYTPAWQAPDEPAHYNYIRYLAEQHRFPVLKPGDYPAAYLDELKAAHFPSEMPITPIRYEFHQPPLYYLLAVPVYQLFDGALLPLRLLSAVFGGLLLMVVYWAVRELFDRPWSSPVQAQNAASVAREEGGSLALAAAAFVAFLPMHLAVTAAVGNDPLAELLLATILLLAIRYLKVPADAPEEPRTLAILGIASGLALVCKSGIYIAVPLVLGAIAARHLWLTGTQASVSRLFRSAGIYLLPAVAMALPWWARNAALYGGWDVLGLGRHDQVVAGQLRMAEFLARFGPERWVHDFLVGSFQSFWGRFGWMGVLLDIRLYQALALFSVVALAGFLVWAVRAWRCRAGPPWRLAAAGLLAVSVLLALAGYLWYNTRFVQYQGRYLFPALLPISLGVALGWREALRREWAWMVAILLLGAALILGAAGLVAGDVSSWPLLMLLAGAGAFAIRRFLPARWDPLLYALPMLALIPLDLACLFLFIVPQLA